MRALELRPAAPVFADLSFELPFGPEQALAAQRRANGGGCSAAGAARELHLAVGHAVHAARTVAATDVSRGTNGTLRANYNGDIISLSNPTIDDFFNTAAFSIPVAGTFGNAPRNLIIGRGAACSTRSCRATSG